jgi:eukaryotic-like serine/threonine-protein kinase
MSSSPSGPPPTGDLDAPSRVGGRYLLRGVLGRGGMATVHRARDEVLDRDVAIKLLHAHLAQDPAFLDRFRREARAAAALSHPNVVAVHDWGETDEGPFLVLQLIDGPSLREVLRHRGRLLPEEAIAVLGPAAAGIGAAHAAGLVHRDVKPENLLLGLDGAVRVTDFGLARAAASATSTFGTDVLVGSPHYLSPEAVRGEPLDPRADVYALGVVLYEALTGRPPYEAESPFATAVQHTSRRVPPPSEAAEGVPAALDQVVHRATEPDRADRFADARAFATALAGAMPDAGATVPGLLGGIVPDVGDDGGPGRGTAILDDDTTVAARDDWEDWPPPLPDPGPTGTGAGLADLDWGDGGVEDDELAVLDEDRPRPRRRWLVGLLVVLLLLAASAGGGYVLWDRVIAPITDIPPVDGAAEPEAVGALEAAGFDVRVDTDRPYTLEIPEGYVMTQEPTGEARQGATVTLVVSGGPRPVEIADVVGQPAGDAQATLVEQGLQVERTESYHEEVPEGSVIAIDPAAGETVDEASTVTVEVSLGRQPMDVPDVRGDELDAAEAELREAGFETEVTGRSFSSDVPAGAVLSQSPGAGEQRFRGDTVELTLSDGPEPIEVPGVRGDRVDEATETLEELGFVVEVEERGGFGAFLNPGRVFDQDPAPGAEREAGDTVTLFAYEG